jgi:hypothetical protein
MSEEEPVTKNEGNQMIAEEPGTKNKGNSDDTEQRTKEERTFTCYLGPCSALEISWILCVIER